MSTRISKRLFTVEDYHRMVDAGILSEDDRVELIYGEAVAMGPIGPPHNGTVIRALNALFPLVVSHALVTSQGAVRLDQVRRAATRHCVAASQSRLLHHAAPRPSGHSFDSSKSRIRRSNTIGR